jgi:hypothetical protein
MKKIVEQAPAKERVKIVNLLGSLGFETISLGSLNYDHEKLLAIRPSEVQRVREAFLKFKHPRFLKDFSYDLPYGTKKDYEEKIGAASLEKLAKLIAVCSFLMQTKAYLLWKKGD